MLKWNRYSILGLTFVGLFLLLFYRYPPNKIFSIIYKLEAIEENGSSSVVKDVRGGEPYITIKMKCFYQDTMDYGDKWRKIMENDGCHDYLFNTCFRNRTQPGRQETHVLTFIRAKDTKPCVCIDAVGWCKSQCVHKIDIKCCLDKGKTPVLCRK